MLEMTGDIWDYHEPSGAPVAITVNMQTNRRGRAIMGAGVALEAAQRFPDLPGELGKRWSAHEYTSHVLTPYNLVAMPVKYRWDQPADTTLIRTSAHELVVFADLFGWRTIYSVRPGCGSGGLPWWAVKKVLVGIWDDRFTIVERKP